ncbi:multiple epidermal growth factor-like domains protein 6 isoform X1 [Haliotis cracherodii]|uniref:multiple epidermal growth factor-like domains protein 6 isoform X1 n=1 Tax=Haliotis cracherodii TaxID=6455 RepID=UPI0039EAA20D
MAGSSLVTVIVIVLPFLTGTVLGSACGPHCYFCKPPGSCTHCNSGWYGSGCKTRCPPTCPGSCHKTTGFCKSCLEGTYGNLCQEKCSPNCSGGRLCNRRDGDCTEGCQQGFHGSRCTVKCGHCVDGDCERLSGSCAAGCTDGWTGLKCSVACMPGCIKCTAPNACVLCEGDLLGPFCDITRNMTAIETTILPSPPANKQPLNNSDIAQTEGESGAVVGISLGIIFTIIIVLLIVCILVYTDGIRKIRRVFDPVHKAPRHPQHEPLYHHDALGSPTISRSHLKLNEHTNRK